MSYYTSLTFAISFWKLLMIIYCESANAFALSSSMSSILSSLTIIFLHKKQKYLRLLPSKAQIEFVKVGLTLTGRYFWIRGLYPKLTNDSGSSLESNFIPAKSQKNTHCCVLNSLISVNEIIQISLRAAQTRLMVPGRASKSFEKMLISRKSNIGHRLIKSLVRASLLVLNITILMQKRMRMRTGCGASEFFTTSTIFYTKFINLLL